MVERKGEAIRNKDRDNRRRREKSRIERGGVETHGRPAIKGMTKKYTDNLTDDEWEFARAMHDYIIRTGDRFPTWSKILTLLKDLGYKKC